MIGAHMTLTPCCSFGFNGNCRDAIGFYERVLGATAYVLLYKDSPMAGDVAADWGDKVCHATLKIGDATLMMSDQPDGKYVAPQGFELVIPMTDPAEAERLFHDLADGGRVKLPLQQTFWATRFGLIVDRFGINWTINCEGG